MHVTKPLIEMLKKSRIIESDDSDQENIAIESIVLRKNIADSDLDSDHHLLDQKNTSFSSPSSIKLASTHQDTESQPIQLKVQSDLSDSDLNLNKNHTIKQLSLSNNSDSDSLNKPVAQNTEDQDDDSDDDLIIKRNDKKHDLKHDLVDNVSSSDEADLKSHKKIKQPSKKQRLEVEVETRRMLRGILIIDLEPQFKQESRKPVLTLTMADFLTKHGIQVQKPFGDKFGYDSDDSDQDFIPDEQGDDNQVIESLLIDSESVADQDEETPMDVDITNMNVTTTIETVLQIESTTVDIQVESVEETEISALVETQLSASVESQLESVTEESRNERIDIIQTKTQLTLTADIELSPKSLRKRYALKAEDIELVDELEIFNVIRPTAKLSKHEIWTRVLTTADQQFKNERQRQQDAADKAAREAAIEDERRKKVREEREAEREAKRRVKEEAKAEEKAAQALKKAVEKGENMAVKDVLLLDDVDMSEIMLSQLPESSGKGPNEDAWIMKEDVQEEDMWQEDSQDNGDNVWDLGESSDEKDGKVDSSANQSPIEIEKQEESEKQSDNEESSAPQSPTQSSKADIRIYKGKIIDSDDDEKIQPPKILNWVEKVRATEVVPVRNEFIEQEAEEEDDEFKGLGGADGDQHDYMTKADMEMIVETNEVINHDDVIELHNKQVSAENQKEVDKLITDVISGALRKKGFGVKGRKNRENGEFELDDSDDDQEMIARFKNKYAKYNKPAETGTLLERYSENPETKAYAECFLNMTRFDDMTDFITTSVAEPIEVSSVQVTQFKQQAVKSVSVLFL